MKDSIQNYLDPDETVKWTGRSSERDPRINLNVLILSGIAAYIFWFYFIGFLLILLIPSPFTPGDGASNVAPPHNELSDEIGYDAFLNAISASNYKPAAEVEQVQQSSFVKLSYEFQYLILIVIFILFFILMKKVIINYRPYYYLTNKKIIIFQPHIFLSIVKTILLKYITDIDMASYKGFGGEVTDLKVDDRVLKLNQEEARQVREMINQQRGNL